MRLVDFKVGKKYIRTDEYLKGKVGTCTEVNLEVGKVEISFEDRDPFMIYINPEYWEEYNENPMPKLEAGMVIEVDFASIPKSYFIVMGDWAMDLDGRSYAFPLPGTIHSRADVKAVYTITSPCGLEDVKDNLELIWEKEPKKTEQQLKIEELEQTINQAKQQIEELKEIK